MKKFLINSTSTLMSAAVVGGALLLAPAPAEANDEVKNILTAVIVGAIVKKVFYDDERGEGLEGNTPWGSEHNPINERHRPGYSSGANDPRAVCGTKVIRHGNYAEQVKVNCYGQVLSTRIIRR